MYEVGAGLLNRSMLRTIKERWHQGGIAVIYVHFRSACSTAQAALQLWESAEVNSFWHHRLENDYFYLLCRKAKDESIEEIVGQSSTRLSDQLQVALRHRSKEREEDRLYQFHVGTAIAHPPGTEHLTETIVYRMLLEAMEQSAYTSFTSRSERYGEVQSAAAVEAVIGEKRSDGMLASSITLQGQQVTIGELAASYPTFTTAARVSELAYLFETNPKAQGAVIVEEGRPVGLLMKEKLHQLLAGQFGLSLYWNRPVRKIMNDQPLIVDEQMLVEQVSQLAMARDYSQLYDVVIITREGQMIGTASIRAILESMTVMRTEAARTANPLTGLPGNEGIQGELRLRIERQQPFAVIYADLDYFKWFNDYFGFGLGDKLIRYLADLLSCIVQQVGKSEDFVGHIGGDDFIIVTDVTYAERICQLLIKQFESGVKPFYGGVSVKSVENRHGETIEQEGVTLSLSLMIWDGEIPLTTEYISRFAAKLKKQAKAQPGNIYVVDQITAAPYGEERRGS